MKVLGDIRDVLVEILGAARQQDKHEEQVAQGVEGGPHDDFRRELAQSVKDAIQSGMRVFGGRDGSGGLQPTPTLPSTPQMALRPSPQPTAQATPGRQPFQPMDMGNPFKDSPLRKPQADGVSTPAVVPVAGPAPTANLLPVNVPVEMRTGVNLPVTVPTTNMRPMGSMPTTLSGFPGMSPMSHHAFPTTPGLLGNLGAGRRQAAGGNQGAGYPAKWI